MHAMVHRWLARAVLATMPAAATMPVLPMPAVPAVAVVPAVLAKVKLAVCMLNS